MDVLHARCAGLDVHRDSVVACARLVTADGTAYEIATFGTMVAELERLAAWLTARGVTQVAMEATGVYWKPVWASLAAQVELILAMPPTSRMSRAARPTSTTPPGSPTCSPTA